MQFYFGLLACAIRLTRMPSTRAAVRRLLRECPCPGPAPRAIPRRAGGRAIAGRLRRARGRAPLAVPPPSGRTTNPFATQTQTYPCIPPLTPCSHALPTGMALVVGAGHVCCRTLCREPHYRIIPLAIADQYYVRADEGGSYVPSDLPLLLEASRSAEVTSSVTPSVVARSICCAYAVHSCRVLIVMNRWQRSDCCCNASSRPQDEFDDSILTPEAHRSRLLIHHAIRGATALGLNFVLLLASACPTPSCFPSARLPPAAVGLSQNPPLAHFCTHSRPAPASNPVLHSSEPSSAWWGFQYFKCCHRWRLRDLPVSVSAALGWHGRPACGM